MLCVAVGLVFLSGILKVAAVVCGLLAAGLVDASPVFDCVVEVVMCYTKFNKNEAFDDDATGTGAIDNTRLPFV